jgi:pimeloyl-ACP methyl ester carboxylesterase
MARNMSLKHLRLLLRLSTIPALTLPLTALRLNAQDTKPAPPSHAPTPTTATAPAAVSAAALSFPGETIDSWHGFRRHRFQVDGCEAWVVEPKKALPGNPLSWCMEFPDAFTERCAAPQLLEAGFHHAHIVVGNTFGCPAALGHFDAFYKALRVHGLAEKLTLIGLSRGGFYAYRWAEANPEKVTVIYGDAPVCDFKSWPGGKGKGQGSPADWTSLISLYGFKNEAEALAWPGNPLDNLAPLAKAKVALIHVVGDDDTGVPVAENTALVEQRYKALGGEIKVIHKPGIGHHPHGLDDPKPVVDFILKHSQPQAR